MKKKAFRKVYTNILRITKATCQVKATGVRYGELAWIHNRPAQVISVMDDLVTLQIFGGTDGLSSHSHVIFTGHAPTIKVDDLLAGRTLNAMGSPIDEGPELRGEERLIKGPTINPVQREQPATLLATGIAGIDLNNTLVAGQKIPFFADPDQPYNQVMAEVALRAEADKIILGGMGISHDDYLYFKDTFEQAGVQEKIISFINTSEDPPLERLLIPDMVCTAAEYFAHDKQEKVLVLLTDMTLYADALAIVANKMDQIPSKDSMPGSLYSDLAGIYEKAAQFKHGGSITILAVTTLNE
ncbi:MAG: V-type ATP synthase subunit B, partial [Fulvivirga sp.]|nr:V-type ATP synthase subunit B [Fulvivirga sp.]